MTAEIVHSGVNVSKMHWEASNEKEKKEVGFGAYSDNLEASRELCTADGSDAVTVLTI